MTSTWPWFEVVNSSTDLQQGDILEGLIVPVLNRGSGDVEEEEYAAIVMTQSCDIEDNISHVIFCPLWSRSDLAQYEPAFNNDGTVGNLLKGRMTGFYPITKCELNEMERPWRIVQFQRILELARDDTFAQLSSMGNRLRLLPPYRESLAQQFARFFMRVGLPLPVDTS